MDTLFGEGQSGLKVVLFVIVVLGLLALAFWLLRQFGRGRLVPAPCGVESSFPPSLESC